MLSVPCPGRPTPPGAWVGVEPVVWRVVAIVASGELAQDTSIKTKTESAEPSMIALFMMHYSFLFANL